MEGSVCASFSNVSQLILPLKKLTWCFYMSWNIHAFRLFLYLAGNHWSYFDVNTLYYIITVIITIFNTLIFHVFQTLLKIRRLLSLFFQRVSIWFVAVAWKKVLYHCEKSSCAQKQLHEEIVFLVCFRRTWLACTCGVEQEPGFLTQLMLL